MPDTKIEYLKGHAIDLLSRLVQIPSISGNESGTADEIQLYFQKNNIPVQRNKNNIWVKNLHFDNNKPTILLNSHHDTVKPNNGYTREPYSCTIEDGKLYGLGSNDAGGALVSLMAVFIYFYEQLMPFNLILAATAEEETSGMDGISAVLPLLGKIDFALVGEPTLMDAAIAEKGLMVIDCIATGTSSHAAHINPDNAIYNAIRDIDWIKSFRFPKSSALLGEVKATVTLIEAGTQHNVVPAECQFTIDVRTNECYTNEEIIGIIKDNISSKVIPRSLRLRSSCIDSDHILVQSARKAGCRLYGSPTISDQALMPFPSIKIGPGDSLRSHSADEFIYLREIEEGIERYISILTNIG